ncbi:hypothetical protein JXL83_10220 [candidate division WOR-3 bacterium]|nr:hypothetical protein [candidate division WOR-3 bacterium]
MKLEFYIIIFLMFTFSLFVFFRDIVSLAPPEITWNKTYGNFYDGKITCIHQTADGGFVASGVTGSETGSNNDYWLIKTDAYGNEIWARTFGGPQDDVCEHSLQTSDGGYIMIGRTFTGVSHSHDIFIVRTDASGELLWSKTYGEVLDDFGVSILQVSDGGFVVIGFTDNFGGGWDDIWLIRTDKEGDTLWTKTFGGYASDLAYSINATSDGGLIIAGSTESFGDDSAEIIRVMTDTVKKEQEEQGCHGPDQSMPVYFDTCDSDGWLIRVDASGEIVWSKTYGECEYDHFYHAKQTQDGGFIVTGVTRSAPGGFSDIWLVKTDGYGEVEWSKSFGGEKWDVGIEVEQVSDGDFIVIGYTDSFGAGGKDVWLLKTDASGNLLWSKYFGETNEDSGYSIDLTHDGGCIIAGNTYIPESRHSDPWLIKLGSISE